LVVILGASLFIFRNLESDHHANTADHSNGENNRPSEIEPGKAPEKRDYRDPVP